MVKTLKREVIGGGYSNKRKIIIDACEMFGAFEIMAMYEDGEEIESKTAENEADALKTFDEIFNNHAGKLQKAVCGKLKEGEKYTLVFLNDFGFPVTQKIVFHSATCTTYAQHSDCIDMIFTPYRKRAKYRKYFYNCSLMIFEGWQDLKETDTKEVVRDDGETKLLKSKYACFDRAYIEDVERILKNPVVIYKDYKTGVNGKVYA